MTEQAEAKKDVILNGIKMEEGRVYLRDKRNGTVYQFEDTLSRMGFIESFVYGEEEPTVDLGAVVVSASMSALERAAAWDEKARQNLKANTVVEVAADDGGAKEANTPPPATPPVAPQTPPATPGASPTAPATMPPAPPAAPPPPPAPPAGK
jgi:hypothetical protein